MIIRTKKDEPVAAEIPRTAYKFGIAVFAFAFVAVLAILAWTIRDSDDAVPVPKVAKLGQQSSGVVKAEPAPTQESVSDGVQVRSRRKDPVEKNNFTEQEMLEIGSKQAERLRRELEERPELTAQQRSNRLHTIYLLETGQVILQ